MNMKKYFLLLLISNIAVNECKCQYELIIRNGIIYDGSGNTPFKGDIAINGDSIAAIGNLEKTTAKKEIDAKGRAIAPGFINVLGHSEGSLIQDSSSQSDIRQGVTIEIMGEGSAGPFTPQMTEELKKQFGVELRTLGDFYNYLEKKGVSCNVACFVGSGNIREFVIGEDNRRATSAQLDSMCFLVKQAMQEGALGVSSALIYPPDVFNSTDELIAECKVASKYGGSYASHMRSEGNRLYEGLEELITIAKQANIHAEIYHLKAAGKDNWVKMDSVIKRVERARTDGLNITADMYTYLAGATGLTTCFPPSLQDGGFGKLWERLQNPIIRDSMKRTMNTNAMDWENNYYAVGSPDKILMLQFAQDSLKKFTGKTLAQVAKIRGTSPEETAMDLIVQDSTRIEVAYFLMSEENIKKQLALPWVSFCSDAGSYSMDSIFMTFNPHPRAFGNFARVIGKYVRDEHLLTLQQAVYKLSKLPATNLKLLKRGELKVGYYADVLVFDSAKVKDYATFDNPHQYSTGMIDVFVNGVQVLKDGVHTGATPGRFLKGPGYNMK